MFKELNKKSIELRIQSYISEIRIHFIYVFLALVILFTISYEYIDAIIYILSKPFRDISIDTKEYQLIFTDLYEAFYVYIKLALYCSICVTLPISLLHILCFLWQALYRYEQKVLIYTIILSITLFILSNLLLFNVILPTTFKFFTLFERSKEAVFVDISYLAKVSEYFSAIINIGLIVNLVVQIPTILYFAIKLSSLQITMFSEKRDLVYFSLFLLTIVITPPDLFTQSIMCLFFIAIYEIALFIIISQNILTVSKSS